MLNNLQIIQKLKEIRTNLNLNQKQFAKLIGVNPKTITFWESGKNLPSQSKLFTICNICNLPDNYFGEFTLNVMPNVNNNSIISVSTDKFINIPYWEYLPESMKHLEVDYIPVQRKVIEVGWKLNPDKLRIVPMVGDKMTDFWYHINEDDLLIIDTSQNIILGNGVYFATSRNNTMFWVREMQNLVNGDIQIKGYAPSGETLKTFNRNQLAEVDFKIIGKVIKNVSFRL